MESVVVGRKRTKEPDPGRKAVVVNIKGSTEWKEWCERASAHCRIPLSSIFDLGFAMYVKANGFTEKPPER